MRVKHIDSTHNRRLRFRAWSAASWVMRALSFAGACTVLGCAARGGMTPRWSVTELSALRAGGAISLVDAGSSLYAVFSDIETQSLTITEVPISVKGIKADSVKAVFMDKTDEGPTRSPRFGELAAASAGTTPNVLYLDIVSEDSGVLKWLSRPKTDWRVDTLEPSGMPVALSAASGSIRAYWAAAGELLEGDGRGAARVAAAPFTAAAPGCDVGDGFTVYDLSSGRLLYVKPETGGESIREVQGGRQIHSSALRGDGTLAVVVYEPETRRIVLFEQGIGGAKTRGTLVTQSIGTGCLALTSFNDGYLFLYDAAEVGGGTETHSLFLLYPQGGRYERLVLLTSKEPITGLKALLKENSLYVLVSGGTLDLITVSFSSK